MISQINKIGVELEGGWEGKRAIPSVLLRMKDDGSVRISKYGALSDDLSLADIKKMKNDSRPHRLLGEVCSKPFSNFASLCSWIYRSYPHQVNSTCGFHIHISAKTREGYSLFGQESFWDLFRTTMQEWGEKFCSDAEEKTENGYFWRRFEGDNQFCCPIFEPINSLRGGSRYRQLNFRAYIRHKTLECRLFPIFKRPEKSIAALSTFVKVVETHLKRARPDEESRRFLAVLPR